MKIVITTRDGQTHDIAAVAGTTLLEAIRFAGIDDLLALCGDCCSCATFHVMVDQSCPEMISPTSPDEDDLLDASDHRVLGSRLSCQILLDDSHDGLQVTIAPAD